MKKWILVGLSLVIVAAVGGVNAFFCFRQSSELENAMNRIGQLEQAQAEQQSALQSSADKVQSLEGGIELVNLKLALMETGIENLNEAVNDIGADFSLFNTGLDALTGELESIRAVLSSLGADYIDAAAIARETEPVIVYIEASLFSFRVSGSGILVSQAGHVITNYHVIEGMNSIHATLSTGQRFAAAVIGFDAGRDIAILKLDSPRLDFPSARLGDSSQLAAGQDVLALGFPYPLGDNIPGNMSVTRGVVSAVRSFDGYEYIQTDAAINPGNSGGALIDLTGELIGVNVAKYVDIDIEGIGFAIPVDEIKSFILEHVG
ncbi:MAG: trypsin-like peptidase domain-containing protein [Dehalococcoidaceae bacterium]|nr:trypsin-like peptidase domain-containing protein [Dehalococcoidaceae bacterium]